MANTKSGQSQKQRQEINAKLVKEVKRLLKPLPLEVIGHLDSAAMCCRNGTVALVKIDQESLVSAKDKSK